MKQNTNPSIEDHPLLSREWHPEKNAGFHPGKLSSGTPKKIWWICPRGHEYQSKGTQRIRGQGCPYCSNKKILTGFNDLATTDPEVLPWWDDTKNVEFSPTEIGRGTGRKVFWLCPGGHSVFREPSKIISRGICCQNFPARGLKPGENDLATGFLSLVGQWSPNQELMPSDVTASSSYAASWLCPEFGHRYQMTVSNKTKGQGCPYCSNKKILTGFNDLATTNPEIAAQWHPEKNAPTTSTQIFAGSPKKFWWKCRAGHEWKAAPNTRKRNGCPYCSNQMLLKGLNDLETLSSTLTKQWHPTLNAPLTPSDVPAGSMTKRWWICDTNPKHEWQATPQVRMKEHGCPFCAGVFVFPGETDIRTTHPNLWKEIDRDFYSESAIERISAGTGKKIHWVCSQYPDHKYQTAGAKRLAGQGCPYCSGHQVLVGFNDLLSRNPALAAEWNWEKNRNFSPAELTAASNKRVWWTCVRDETHKWRQSVSVRRYSGCPTCAPGGFDSGSPATVYFIEQDELMAQKVGITSAKSNRIQKFRKEGWTLVKKWEFESGSIALDIETLFFQWLRKEKKLPRYLGVQEMPRTGGSSETFEMNIIPSQNVIEKIEGLAKFLIHDTNL